MTFTKKQVKKMLHDQRKSCAETFGKSPATSSDAQILQAIHKTPLVKIDAYV